MATQWGKLPTILLIYWFLLSLNNICLTVAIRETYNEDPEFKLAQHLVKNYKARVEVRPVEKRQDPVIVTFDLAYSQLIDLDGKNQILTSNVWVRQKWTNKKISWNKTEFGGCDNITMSPDYFWKPDIVLYNTIEGGGEMYNFDTKIVFRHDGFTQWFAPAQIKTICSIDITHFPFDEQKCEIIFGSWSYTENVLDMRLEKDTADLARYTDNGEWNLISLLAERKAVNYSCCPHPFVTITYVVHVQRRVLFYLNNIIIPCIILNLMTLLAFLLPHDSGERISLVITILLGLTVYMLIFTENIPNSSVVIPIIGKFSMACFVEISACLLVTTFTSRCYFHGVDQDMPAWFHYLIFRLMAPAFFINPPKNDVESESETTKQLPVEVPLLTNCPNGHAIPNGRSAGFHSHPTSYLKRSSFADTGEGHDINSCETKLQKILSIMERHVEEKREEAIAENKKKRWHFAAVILDRFFFILFAVTISVSVMSFYMQIPSKN